MNSFADFWIAYPRRVAKKAAEKAWLRAVKKTEPSIILAALESTKRREWRERETQFIPHAATWINATEFDEFEERTELLIDEIPQGHRHWCESCPAVHSWDCSRGSSYVVVRGTK